VSIKQSYEMKVLIVEDEVSVVAFLKQGLEEQGYDVDVALDGITGEFLALQQDYDIVLLDLVLPNMKGVDLCKKIREKDDQLPVLMLTALGNVDSKISGFEAGADDYLTKPFEFRELVARIKVLTKRNSSNRKKKSTLLKVCDLELDTINKTVCRDGKKINLTAKEFLLLEFLMKNRGRVVSRGEIAEHVWEITFDTGTNVVDVYINILRKKIDRDFSSKLIHTRVGLGYIMEEQ
jgi:two-component system, OmpR family, copper resistance phosphate regulon response regulator CusR